MNFCMRLAKKAMLNELKTGQNKNILTSPLSFNMVLNMVATGSRGHTLHQLLYSLKSKNEEELMRRSTRLMSLAVSNGGSVLSIVNGVWVDHRFPIKPMFQRMANLFYDTDARAVDFVNKVLKTVSKDNL